MKKWIVRIMIGVVVLIVLAVVAAGLFLDSGIKKGIELVGPRVAQVPVKLDSVSVSLLSGAGQIKGLVVGNPPGYKSPFAIQVGKAELAIKSSSLLSDKVVIRNIDVQAPEVTFETDLQGNNLSKIVSNLEEASGGTNQPAAPEPQGKASRKLEVDNLVISGGKIHVSVTALGSKSATVPLPEIHLTGLGQGPDGITAAELTKRVLQAIEKEAVQAASGAVADLGKQAGDLSKGLQKETGGVIDNATKSIGGLFKKKQ